ncbi:EutN/CcmL family microcompartment protein [Martelella alba]|uniref:Ethanolamine utilization protein EutN n=1 Tax=Martelella alba TaxID=2590451 RepID=A0ABY2SR56_9HYPH|nr:EutN/CcmL family microcompartment protein [Martelella alba]TKI08053.1 ethanolamine utilization protein EutN [Martelella alba]
MQLARVIGSVVSTQKSPSLLGKKLMVVEPVNTNGAVPTGLPLQEVAVDSVGAGVGETVLLARGASARWVFAEPNQAIDLAIVAIVDSVDY